ncbi:MAG: hypothetical protein IPG90_17185 [Bacteroidetes bacterium]|nr:hypothetical protein [Bacteroidota bacterium]
MNLIPSCYYCGNNPATRRTQRIAQRTQRGDHKLIRELCELLRDLRGTNLFFLEQWDVLMNFQNWYK